MKKLLLIFSLAFLLRLVLVPNPGFEADVSFWKSWGLATVDFGIVEGLKVSNNNYPTPFAYTLGAMVWVYKLFADPHNFNQFWSNTNTLFLAISKMLPIAADFGIAGIILLLTRSLLMTSLYLFNPVALIDGAWWGQVDSAGVFLFLLAVVFVVKKMPFVAGLVYMLAMMTKLQNMIYGPLFFLYIFQTMGYHGVVRAVGGTLTGFVGLNIEFVFAKEMARVFESLTQNYDYFPYASLNAFNLWWVVVGGEGMKHSDKFLTIGLVNAKQMGLYIFASIYLFATLHIISRLSLKSFLEGVILVNGAFFLFMTQSHDRYAFPIIVFLLIWAATTYGKSGRLRKFVAIYSLFSLLYFYNLHSALILNYPANGLPIPFSIPFSIVTAIVFLVMYAWFVIKTTKKTIIIITVIIFITMITGKNLPLLQKQPVSLTRLTPHTSEQAWGRPVLNMPVGAAGASKNWKWLSVQYAFYRSGIGTHANSRLVYDVNRLFRRFETDYGIDTEAGNQGSAIFEIRGDGKILFASEPIGRFDLPRHADVDIVGVKNLELVTKDNGSNVDDHTDWLTPTLWE